MTFPKTSAATNLFQLAFEGKHTIAERIALLHDDCPYSYAELLERAARLAKQLQLAEVNAGGTVGICLERSPELVFSVLGIVEAGAAYVPIDPSYPTERIAGMLEDAKPPVVITSKAHQHLFQGTAAKVLLHTGLRHDKGIGQRAQRQGHFGHLTNRSSTRQLGKTNLCHALLGHRIGQPFDAFHLPRQRILWL